MCLHKSAPSAAACAPLRCRAQCGRGRAARVKEQRGEPPVTIWVSARLRRFLAARPLQRVALLHGRRKLPLQPLNLPPVPAAGSFYAVMGEPLEPLSLHSRSPQAVRGSATAGGPWARAFYNV